MNRSDFLRRLALTAAGLYIAPELLYRRRFWPGASFGTADVTWSAVSGPFKAELAVVYGPSLKRSIIVDLREVGEAAYAVELPPNFAGTISSMKIKSNMPDFPFPDVDVPLRYGNLYLNVGDTLNVADLRFTV